MSMDRLEAARLAIRGREIVMRQRQVVAKCGDDIPIGSKLLKTFEQLLSLYEKIAATYPPVTEIPIESAEEANWRKAARILEILREAGHHCEILQENLH
jgi:hypothetical protein